MAETKRKPAAKKKAPATKKVSRSIAPHFTLLDDSGAPTAASGHVAVLDARTGLTWAAQPLPGRLTHAAAEAACAALTLCGHTDWRLPNCDELLSLVDRERFSPAIDPVAFPSTPNDWFWTSTPYAASPASCAWIVNFYHGSADYDLRGYDHRVRAVRGSSRQ